MRILLYSCYNMYYATAEVSLIGAIDMNVYKNCKTINKRNCGNTFLRYCLKHNKKLILHWFTWLSAAILFHCHIISKQVYITKKWNVIGRVDSLESILLAFKTNYMKTVFPWFQQQDHCQDVLIDDTSPQFLLEYLFGNRIHTVYGLPISRQGVIASLSEFEQLWNKDWEDGNVYLIKPERTNHRRTETYVVCGKCYHGIESYRKQLILHLIMDGCLLLLFSFILLMMTLCFATVHVRWDIVESIMNDRALVFLNFVPILMLLTLLYCLFGSLSSSILTGGMIIFILSMVNYFKLMYRDEPFVISDILLIQEAGDMAGKYTISFGYKQWLVILLLIGSAWLLVHYYHQVKQCKWLRLGIAIISICVSNFLFQGIYQDGDLYDRLGDTSIINRWSPTQNYQVRGFLYPFLYSNTYAVEREPENYDPEVAKRELASYEYDDMDENKKANIIGIMLESYNDFSRYDSIELASDPYENFHAIQDESIAGAFISNIFAGGTVASERSFLNGYKNHPSYLIPTNSFVRYFNEQGYYTEALHPSYGWFYNRRNINSYLGFDNFYYIENHFQEIVGDHVLFQEIIDGYERNKERDQPYFNFTVTYQNHGPYASTPQTEETYLIKNDGIEDESYQIVNNYLSGIADTDSALKELFDYFRLADEPVIIVMFGDHNPLLGDGNGGYVQNGLNLDLGTVKGFKEYYEIPYIIWANDYAKEMYSQSFVGSGDSFSAMYFLPYLFQYLGMEGNEYMQYLNDLYETMPVLNDYFYLVNGEWKKELNQQEQALYDSFVNTEYYYSHNLQ